MKAIFLTRGKVALVDDVDFKRLNCFSWYALSNSCGNLYAARDIRKNGKRKILLMHREILKNLGEKDGEHRDGDGLNNCRANLRPATRTQNHANRKRLPTRKSAAFRGVSLHKQSGKFTSQISIRNKKKHLGCFITPKEAARSYDKAAIAIFGEFASLNFPKANEQSARKIER